MKPVDNYSFAAFVYTPEGAVVKEQLWKETMTELNFAKVQGVLDGMKTQNSNGSGNIEVP